MTKRSIYISGMITGLHPDIAYKLFAQAEMQLKQQGWRVINPITLDHNHDLSWENYMLTDIKEIFSIDAMYMLGNWRNSRGARIERAIAKELGKAIIYQNSADEVWWLKRLLMRKEESSGKLLAELVKEKHSLSHKHP